VSAGRPAKRPPCERGVPRAPRDGDGPKSCSGLRVEPRRRNGRSDPRSADYLATAARHRRLPRARTGTSPCSSKAKPASARPSSPRRSRAGSGAS
jgi:hypothetical protein